MNFDYHKKPLFLFSNSDAYICRSTAGFVIRAMGKRQITLVVVMNLHILLLYNISAFCNFYLLLICYDFISHTILRNGNIEIKLLLLNPGFPFIKREQGETPQSGQPAERSKKSQAKTSVPKATNAPKNSRANVDLLFQFFGNTIAPLRATPGGSS